MRNVEEMVWPVPGYTDKIHSGLKSMFVTYPWLTFTVNQMESSLTKGFPWLVINDDRQRQVLHKIISTGVRKLIQAGTVQKVTSQVSVEDQWMAVKGVEKSAYTNITSEEDVAQTDEAKKASSSRAVSPKKLWKMNHS